MTEPTQIYLLLTAITITSVLTYKATKSFYKENRYNQKLK